MQQLHTPHRYRLFYPDVINFLPAVPRNVEETGIPYNLILDLCLRKLFLAGMVSGLELSRELCLPYNGVIEQVLERLVRDQQADFTGGQGYGRAYFDYQLTEKGRERARDAFERTSYVGPAPVPLQSYINLVRKQMREVPRVGRSELVSAFHDMVLDENFYQKLGPAVNSVRSLFLYGAPGNGKTSIAERIASVLSGEVWIPYALEVDSQIIQVYDPLIHRIVESLPAGYEAPVRSPSYTLPGGVHGMDPEDGETVEVQLPTISFTADEDTAGKAGKVVDVEPFDARWLLTFRPRVVVGGELTLESLDLTYNETGHFYEAPYQVKACSGLLLIDDFGRQKVDPTDLLNRWIVPLEKKIDFLTLVTGKKFEVPFDLLIIFSTNLDPSKLVDEAFLRRIRYKIEVPDPTEKTFRDIFSREAEKQSVAFDMSMLDHFIKKYYKETGRPMRGCHPRDILQLVVDISRFSLQEPAMTKGLLEPAADMYFVHMEGDTAKKALIASGLDFHSLL